MTHTLIYPHTTRHNEHAGHLEIGGCDVVDLAREFGTPLFIYDEQTVRDQCRAYHTAFSALTDAYEVVYASKAFSCRAMCELAAQEGLSLDVATGGELAAAVAAGFPAARVYFHGNNKSVAEIEAGLEAGIGLFVLEPVQLLDGAGDLARRGGQELVGKRLFRRGPDQVRRYLGVFRGQPASRRASPWTRGRRLRNRHRTWRKCRVRQTRHGRKQERGIDLESSNVDWLRGCICCVCPASSRSSMTDRPIMRPIS